MGLRELDEGAWDVNLGGRELRLRPLCAADYVQKEREQLALRATEEEWRTYMPLHYSAYILWLAARHYQPDLSADDVYELIDTLCASGDGIDADWWAELYARCLGGTALVTAMRGDPEPATPATPLSCSASEPGGASTT